MDPGSMYIFTLNQHLLNADILMYIPIIINAFTKTICPVLTHFTHQYVNYNCINTLLFTLQNNKTKAKGQNCLIPHS